MAEDRPHRWGKLNHGQTYGLLADDVARRLATINLGAYERLLLNHVREHSWARSTRRNGRVADAIPFAQTITQVVDEIGSGIIDKKARKYLRKQLYAAAESLKGDRILVDADGPEGGLLINTNCDEWKTYAREFLPPCVGLAYALKAQSGYRDEPTPAPADTQPNGYGVPNPVGMPYPTEWVRDTQSSGYAPIEDRAREDSETPEDQEEKTPQPPASGGDGRRDDPGSDPAERVRAEVAAIVLKATQNAILAESYGAAGAAKVRDEGYAPGDVLTAWAAVTQARTAPRNWGSTVASNLANRKARGEAAAGRARASAAPTPALFVPPVAAGVPRPRPVYQRFDRKGEAR